jgi:hypothetical protein
LKSLRKQRRLVGQGSPASLSCNCSNAEDPLVAVSNSSVNQPSKVGVNLSSQVSCIDEHIRTEKPIQSDKPVAVNETSLQLMQDAIPLDEFELTDGTETEVMVFDHIRKQLQKIDDIEAKYVRLTHKLNQQNKIN